MHILKRILTNLPIQSILQRVPGIAFFALIGFSTLGPYYAPIMFISYFLILHCFFFYNIARFAYGAYYAYHASIKQATTNWENKYIESTGAINGSDERHDMPYDHVIHVIILPNYKENIDTLCETLDVLASHSRALTQYRVCLAMEESESECIQKATNLLHLYKDLFFELTYTVHPSGRQGEIRGKSSNVAWASKEMASRYGGGVGGNHGHEMVTIMDADTCFAEDYFNSIAYHFCVASPEQRRILMFAPSTLFDRNANNVPVFVRVTDMFWSLGVMSNLNDDSLVKLPCSAYSLSMNLAIAVNFWDSGPEAIGEDLHMYLKCFFSTKGRVIMQSVYSPASQCNVEGQGSGLYGYISGIQARYTQGVRHLWGTLDTGYAFKRTLLSLFALDEEPAIQLKHAHINKLGKEESTTSLPMMALFTLLHRLLEAHILVGHFLIMAFLSSFLSSETISTFHPIVGFGLQFAAWIRFATFPGNLIMIFYYEKYHRFNGFERWVLQDRSINKHSLESKHYLGELVHTHAKEFKVSPAHAHLKVQRLGKRASLASSRDSLLFLFDWLHVGSSGLVFYALPLFYAQVGQLLTNRLDYKVASKPTVSLSRSVSMESSELTQVEVVDSALKSFIEATPGAKIEDWIPLPAYEENTAFSFKSQSVSIDDFLETKSTSSKGDEGYFEGFEDLTPDLTSREVI